MSIQDVIDSIDIEEYNQQGENQLEIPKETPPPPEKDMVSVSTTKKVPTISTTTVSTEMGENAMTREDWEKMTGKERLDAFYDRLKVQPPAQPIDTADREKRLRTQGMLKAIGNGLTTLTDAIGLGRGASVRRKEYGVIPEYKMADDLRNSYNEDMQKWNERMKNYYDSIYQQNNILSGQYEKYLDNQRTKTSNTTTTGGDVETFQNQEFLDKQRAHELKKLRYSRSNSGNGGGGNTVKLTYPNGFGGNFNYSYDDSKYSLATAASVTGGLMKRLDLDANEKSQLAEILGREKSLYPNKWTTDDQKKALPKLIQFILKRRNQLQEERSMLYQHRDENPAFYRKNDDNILKEKAEYDSMLEEITNSGINIEE
jgi:hypothetical protein